MKDLNNILVDVINTVPGFTDVDELRTLFTIAFSLRGDVVEIGSWLGRSSIALGMASSYFNRKVYCIDLFPSKDEWRQNKDGTWSIVTKDKISAYKSEHRIYDSTFLDRFLPAYSAEDSTLKQFTANVKRYELEDTIIPFRGDISSFVKRYSVRPMVIFIDGDHDYLSVRRDIEVSTSILDNNGVICIDDTGGVFEGVTRAVRDSRLSSIVLTTKKLSIAVK